MSIEQPGTRVLALRNVDTESKTVYSFGAGVYEGDFVPSDTPDYPPEVDLRIIEGSLANHLSPEGRKKHMDMVEAVLRYVPEGGVARPESQIYDEMKTAGKSYDEYAALSHEEQVKDLWQMMSKNPRILLDNGSYCWGFECWWGPEERMRAEYPESEYTWVEVTQTYAMA